MNFMKQFLTDKTQGGKHSASGSSNLGHSSGNYMASKKQGPGIGQQIANPQFATHAKGQHSTNLAPQHHF